jgi:hypothetical protein
MRIAPPPIRSQVLDRSLCMAVEWLRWLQAIVKGIENIQTENDVEITDSAKGVILTAPNGTRYRVKVNNAGTLTTTAL